MDMPPKLYQSEIEQLDRLQPCIIAASQRYQVNTEILNAVVLTEGTKVGQVLHNTNGSVDMSVMGINSIHLKSLSEYNIDKSVLLDHPCVNVMIGAWLMKQKLIEVDTNDPAQLWKAIGNYHSRTPVWNTRYQKLIWRNMLRLRAHYKQTVYSFGEKK
ncbi:lytic transglycosylase domain-containing protein [Citrobacter freundii]|uniref:lytic transglycosylase domain-containing protein n=1 Tax=Citrobacter freundii TaxID=546 RepID=UPI0019073C62|nr:lytic transglycosylase domain-containing protein [Citrobacter freundii]MBJ8931620.1 lytic transglycosylase domain-containing protein [Citrobacter freundii]